MKTYKLMIAYDGTHFSGWQVQPNAPTIQAHIQDALKLVLKTPTPVIGSGRTDAGVHALGQVAHFKTEQELDPFRLRAALNGMLPHAIRILSIDEVPDHFHAQYSAKSKEYHYHLFLDKVDDPFRRPYYVKITRPFDHELLLTASRHFIGRHDFTSFANEPGAGAVTRNPVRTLQRLDIVSEPGGFRLEFESGGFLYKMVRNIVGTLLEVATGRRSIEEIPKIFAAKDRREAGSAAPPQGLFLVKVGYPESHLKKETALPPHSEEPEYRDTECCLS